MVTLAKVRKIAYPRGFDIKKATKSLLKKAPEFKPWVQKIGALDVQWHRAFSPVDALARAILYQQLAGKAAATIVARVENILPHGPRIHAQDLQHVAAESLRACGVSGQKQRALQDLGEKALAGIVPTVAQLRWLSDADIIERLTQVRGVGRWTVEMMLIFRLGRQNILPVNDLGIQKGAQLLTNHVVLPTAKLLTEMGSAWEPYCTIASLYLWRIADFDKTQVKIPRSQSN